MKKTVFFLSLLIPFVPIQAEAEETNGYFNHVDLGLTLGATGVGLDVALPVGNIVRVRTGFTYMPHFKLNSSFSLGSSVEGDHPEATVKNMTHFMSALTSLPVDNHVDMKMEPTMNQFKFLVDVMPFRNKRWNLTVGFFAGPSRVGKAYNKTEDAPTLMGVAMYNGIYKKICLEQPIISDADGNPVYYDIHDPDNPQSPIPSFELDPAYSKLFKTRGLMGMALGTFKDGDKAMLVPDENGMVKAEMKVNCFRPYLGAGYSTDLSKDRKWKLAVDAGILFWGGTPQVYVDNVYKINTDNIDPDNYQYDIIRPNEDWSDYVEDEPLQQVSMTKDLQGIKGKVGNMVRTIKKFKVYPNVGVTLSYRLF